MQPELVVKNQGTWKRSDIETGAPDILTPQTSAENEEVENRTTTEGMKKIVLEDDGGGGGGDSSGDDERPLGAMSF